MVRKRTICGALSVAISCCAASKADNLLTDPGFESGNLTAWGTNWLPDQSGAIVTSTAAHAGTFGLWIYTAAGYSGEAFATVFQETSAAPGDSVVASAYIRTPSSGTEWAPGSYACVRLQYLAGTGAILASYDSPHLTTSNTTYDAPYIVNAPPAPAETTHVRFTCVLSEPAGDSRQSVANFDECSLELIHPQNPVIATTHAALGFGDDLVALSFGIQNTGTGTLFWSIASDRNWLQIDTTAGTTTAETDTIQVIVDRSRLQRNHEIGTLSITSDGGDISVVAYVEAAPVRAVPQAPSVVTTSGRQLLVQRRLPNGELESPAPYVIRGVVWSPAGIGTTSAYPIRRSAFADWYRLDLQMMREMNATTVYTFLDFGTDPPNPEAALAILDYCYHNNIMVVMTVDEDGTDNAANIPAVVNAFKNHPAILMWALGNEWNLWRPDRRFYYYHYESLPAAAAAMQANAVQVQSLDDNHPVCSILGEINYPSQAEVYDIVTQVCTAVDVWGANIYRGPEFYGLFDEWATMSPKPLFLSEFGTDAFRTTHWWPPVGQADEGAQADYFQTLWRDLAEELSARDPARVCLGGTTFEWNDEWWKSSLGSPDSHDPDGYVTTWNPIAHPDGFANEEWFGIVDVARRRRAAYHRLAADWAARGDLNCDGLINNFDINPFVLALTDASAYELQFPDCELTNADANRDGVVNNFDIDTFVICLTGGECP
ncbi:MAG: hypothetical protein JNG88_02685 [Phycisphaerales bacterium]|nr:hypothetical protein [Phycisphaerales bacterium]